MFILNLYFIYIFIFSFCRFPPPTRYLGPFCVRFDSAVVPFLSLSVINTLYTVRVQVEIVSAPFSQAICNFSIVAIHFSPTKSFVDRFRIGYGVPDRRVLFGGARTAASDADRFWSGFLRKNLRFS